jgi:PAS domain-containing protein
MFAAPAGASYVGKSGRRKRFERDPSEMTASRNLKDHFLLLFEAAPNGIMAIDAAGCIIQLNAQIEKMFGYSRDELIGKLAEVLVPVRFRRSHAGL